jgi:hypothetical protein
MLQASFYGIVFLLRRETKKWKPTNSMQEDKICRI